MQTVTRERVAEKLWEWDLELSPDISYRLETVFPRIEGWFAKGRVREQFQLIQRLEPLLTELLLEDEEVQLVLKSNQSTFSDIFLRGSLWIESTTVTVLVFTNLRILCIRTDEAGVPQKTFWLIYYSQVQELKRTSFDDARLVLKDGTNLLYSRLSKDDQDWMQRMIQENYYAFLRQGFDPAVTQSREQLCGHCFGVIPPGVFECECCGATYWKPAEVGVRSFLFPSWGDFVMQHRTLAFMELFGFGLLVWFTSASFSEGKYFTGLAVFFMANLADAVLSVQLAARALHVKRVPDKDKGFEI